MVTVLPFVNLATYNYFSTSNSINWDEYYDNQSPRWSRYAGNNQTVVNVTDRAMLPGDFKILGTLPVGEIPVSVGGNATVNVSTLASRLINIGSNGSATVYNCEYDFPSSTISDFQMMTIGFPYLVAAVPPNVSKFWDFVEVYIYLQGSDRTTGHGWRLWNTSSPTPESSYTKSVNVGNKSISLKLYDVDASFNTTRGNFNFRFLDVAKLFPILKDIDFNFDFFGIPIDLSTLIDPIVEDGLDYLLMFDQLHGFYQWQKITVDRVGYSFRIKEGFNFTAVKSYMQDPFDLNFFSTPNKTDTVRFNEFDILIGMVIPTNIALLQIFLFDGIIAAACIVLMVFVNSKKMPGRDEFDAEIAGYLAKIEEAKGK